MLDQFDRKRDVLEMRSNGWGRLKTKYALIAFEMVYAQRYTFVLTVPYTSVVKLSAPYTLQFSIDCSWYHPFCIKERLSGGVFAPRRSMLGKKCNRVNYRG